ncbi:MAG: ATP-binding protein [Tepidisphaeraceae bacterium]|jgi:serine/threonine-protein kinase RsbW
MGTAPRVFKFAIGSDDASARKVQRAIIAEVKRRKFDSDAVFAIRLCLGEALINAIKHGNLGAPDKQVHIEAKVGARQIEITIEDEGLGFDRAAVPNPTLDENLHKCSGRGIHLIEAYMDKVQWSRGGRRVKMVRRNGHGR